MQCSGSILRHVGQRLPLVDPMCGRFGLKWGTGDTIRRSVRCMAASFGIDQPGLYFGVHTVSDRPQMDGYLYPMVIIQGEKNAYTASVKWLVGIASQKCFA